MARPVAADDIHGDPDAERMLAFQSGDIAAFEALFDRWFVPLLRYIEGIVGDAGRAEELAQDVFLRVHGARGRYQPRARFSTWLYRIATNLARNELRRPERRLRRVDRVPDAAVDDSRPATDDVVEARRRSQAVTIALATLTRPQREALWLSQVEGLSHGEIAGVLETSVGSVKMLVRRARLTLAEALRDDTAEIEDGDGDGDGDEAIARTGAGRKGGEADE
ncbi:MAG: RNA polymerase sigma factor [bacterium]